MKLVLFDIDGTLLLTHGVGRRSLEAALQSVLGEAVDTAPVRFSGKTDPQITREVLMLAGREPDDLLLAEVLHAYEEAMRARFDPEAVELLPAAREAVLSLAEAPDIQLGLVTGNLEPMAYLKLEAVGLGAYFPFGGFGSDDPRRDRLPAIALERARALTGHPFEGPDVVIIGDTEHDITCGRGVGAFAVGVCTGRYGRHELEVHGPDLLLDDLRMIDRLHPHLFGPVMTDDAG